MKRAFRLILCAAVIMQLGLASVEKAVASSPTPSEAGSIRNDAEFQRFARIERAGRFMDLPQLIFAIDRSRKPPQVHWVNTKRWAWHFAFLQSKYLTLAESYKFSEANYSKPDRRFILGSVIRYPRLGRYGIELWEGDVVEPALLKEMMERTQASFHAPLTFKPNSEQQRLAAEQAGLGVISAEEAYGSRDQMLLNAGRAVGRLVLVREGEEDRLLPGDIALLTATPIRLPPVAGILSTTFATPVNHVNLLAKSWGIPNAYEAGADQRWRAMLGRQVLLDTRGAYVVVRLARKKEIAAAQKAREAKALRVPVADLSYTGLPALDEQDRDWARRTGTKSANLGEVASLTRKSGAGFDVPPGFAVPFSFYERFAIANGLDKQIAAFLSDPRRNDPEWRAPALAALRTAFANGRIAPADQAAIIGRRRALLGSAGVFVRSSTNSEDLPGFNGAGLYDTVPNLVSDDALADAVKTVWGSLWNDRAFAAREAAGIDHRAVRAACLIQLAVNAEASGVMTTVDPFDERSEEQRIFIAAKRGIGIRVVEGKKIAEQLIYRPSLDSVQVLTRSQDDRMLQFAPNGGVMEVATEPQRAVLTDAIVRSLSKIGLAIEARFGRRPQDIEWLIDDGRIVIVQAREYVRGH